MRSTQVTRVESVTCDECQKLLEDGQVSLSIEIMEDVGVRLFESIKARRSLETKVITNRKIVDFCSKDCARKFLMNSAEMFLQEVQPPIRQKGHSSTF